MGDDSYLQAAQENIVDHIALSTNGLDIELDIDARVVGSRPFGNYRKDFEWRDGDKRRGCRDNGRLATYPGFQASQENFGVYTAIPISRFDVDAGDVGPGPFGKI
jgi:hypothetical protein